MKLSQVFAAWLLTAALPVAAQNAQATAPAGNIAPPATVTVRLETELGPIVLAIETARAPITAANFLRYVNDKRLDGSDFYRAMKIGEAGEYGLLQGGLRGNPKRIFKPCARTNPRTGLRHSAARYPWRARHRAPRRRTSSSSGAICHRSIPYPTAMRPIRH
jgi:peptidyl-prolyl cis-trans isomerase A (cyclophilin A)